MALDLVHTGEPGFIFDFDLFPFFYFDFFYFILIFIF